MADFEKVYSINFNTDRAIAALKRLEGVVGKFEIRIAKAFGGRNISQAIDSLVAKSGKIDKGITSGLGKVDAAALKTRAEFERASRAVNGLGSAMGRASRTGVAGTGAVKTSMSGMSASTDRARRSSDTLNASLNKTARDGVSGTASAKRGIDGLASSMSRAASTGAALDSVMKRASRDGASGMKGVERAVKATETAVKRTDELMARMMKNRGEREKAKSLREIERRIKGIGESSKIATMSVTGLMARMSALIGVARGVRALGSEFVDFDKAAVGASVRFGESMAVGTQGYKDMRREVQEMAVDAGASLAAAAQSTEAWSKAGMNWEQTKKVMPVTLKAAIAMDLPDVGAAGDLLSDALGQFNMRTPDAEQLEKNITRLGDVITKAADISTLDATQIFESFKSAAPMVDVVGGSVEQLAADLVTLGNAGIKGGEAGTQIRSIYGALTAPRGPARDIMKKLGVEINDAKGNFRGLTQILSDFESATKDIGSGEKTGMLTRIVGRENISGFLNLLRTGAAEISKVEVLLNNSAGTMDRVYEGMKKSVTRQIDAVIGQVAKLGISVLEKTDLFGKLGRYVDSIDWKSASNTITTTIIPALEKIGSVIANVVYPACKEAAKLVSEIFSPAISIASALLGTASKGGEGLAKTIGAIIAAWFAYRAAVVVATAFNFVRYFAQIVTGAVSATAAQGTFTAALAASVTQASLLQTAAGAIGAAFAGWTIGTIIFTEIVDPLMKALHAAEQLRDFNKQTLEQDTSKLSENVLAQRQKELQAEMWGLEVTGHKGKNGGKILNDEDSVKYKALKDRYTELDNQRAAKRHIRETSDMEANQMTDPSIYTPGASRVQTRNTPGQIPKPLEVAKPFVPAPPIEIPKPREIAKPIEVKPAIQPGVTTASAKPPKSVGVAPKDSGSVMDKYLEESSQINQRNANAIINRGTTNNNSNKTVQQTVNYTGPTVHLNASGLTEAQAERMLKRALRDDKRDMADAARDAANSADETEY